MKYEVARCRARLSEAFFSTVKSEIGKLRFSEKPDAEKVAQLQILEKKLTQEVGRKLHGFVVQID